MTDDFANLDHEAYNFAKCPTRLVREGPYVLRDVVAAIRKTNGSFIEMSALLGRHRTRIRDWVFGNIEAKMIFDDVREGLLDKVEQSVFKSAVDGDGPNQRFLLSTIGKDRGYSTRAETTGPNNGPVQVEEVTAREVLAARIAGVAARLSESGDITGSK